MIAELPACGTGRNSIAADRDEDERLAALARLEILDTPPESEFDDLTELAALTFKTPAAAISLLASDRQWIKACFGVDIRETARDISICDHTIRSDDVLVVLDASLDDRFRHSPLVAGETGIRFYAAAPLTTPDGHRVGALCVFDFEPREGFSESNAARLKALAASVTQVILRRAAAREGERLTRTASATADLLALAERSANIGTWVHEVATRSLTWSQETYRIYGFDPTEPPPDFETLMTCYHPDDAAQVSLNLARSVNEGLDYERQSQISSTDGVVRHIVSRAFARRDETGEVVALYGTVQDVSDIRRADAALQENAVRLRALNWALTAYGRSTSALLHCSSLDDVLTGVCEAIVADDAYALASVALADPGPGKAVRIAAFAGSGGGYVDGLVITTDDTRTDGRGPTGRAIRSGQTQIMRDCLTDQAFEPWRERALRFGVRSSVTVPFSKDGTVLGVLIVYSSSAAAFGAQEMALFTKLAEELVFSITLEEERARLAASEKAQRLAEDAEAEARQRLVESEARYRMLAERVPDIIMRYNVDGVVEFVSPSVHQLGYTPEELTGRRIDDFLGRSLNNNPGFEALIAGEPLPSGRMNEWPVQRRDGGEVWLQGSPAGIYDEAGVAVGVVTVMRDVTERRAIEEELRRKQAEAEAAAVVKAQFLANMSHEIRTPLTGVLGFTSLLAGMDDLSPRARGYVERVASGGQALLAIVNDVLDFSKLEAGRIELDRQPHDLGALLDEAIELVRTSAEDKGLSLRLEWCGEAPPQVVVDSGRLRQVLLNLLGNAIKFTPAGVVTLAVRFDALAGRLRFDVSDTGVGVSAEHLDRLFLRFSQIDGSDTRRFGGAGLGLAISKGLVEAMGGEIGVDSVEGRGSTFWFTVEAPPADLDSYGDDAIGENHDGSVPPLSILIVDDVAVNRELLAAILAPFGVRATEACNGAEAVEAALRTAFDLILMDLQMPGMDGLAATRAIRANSDLNADTPILAVSANVMPPQVEACREAGMNDHIGKPINPAELLNKIAAWTTPEEPAAPPED